MNTVVTILVLLLGSMAFAQAKPAPSQQAGDCAMNITGSGNTASINCTNIDPKLAEQVRALVSSAQRNEKAAKEISEKLDAILKEVRKQRPAARRIPPERRAEIVSVLARAPARISFAAVHENEEAYQFAQDLLDVFKAAGWTITAEGVVNTFIGAGKPQRGIRLSMHGEPVSSTTSASVSRKTPLGGIVQTFEMLK